MLTKKKLKEIQLWLQDQACECGRDYGNGMEFHHGACPAVGTDYTGVLLAEVLRLRGLLEAKKADQKPDYIAIEEAREAGRSPHRD